MIADSFTIYMDPLQRYRNDLHVGRNATKDEIKKAYKREALKCHPDREGGSETKFKKISEAYNKLTEPRSQALPTPNFSYPTNRPMSMPIFENFFKENIS